MELLYEQRQGERGGAQCSCLPVSDCPGGVVGLGWMAIAVPGWTALPLSAGSAALEAIFVIEAVGVAAGLRSVSGGGGRRRYSSRERDVGIVDSAFRGRCLGVGGPRRVADASKILEQPERSRAGQQNARRWVGAAQSSEEEDRGIWSRWRGQAQEGPR